MARTLLSFGVLLCLFLQVYSQEIVGTNVANSLMECYNNQEYLDANLKRPMTMNYFIDLVRKIENGPTRMDLKMLSTSMLYRFRQDGILKATKVNNDPNLLPYSPYGDEYNKFKFMIRYMIPGNAFIFPNETLNSLEKCTVHLMLSESVEGAVRGDEDLVCQKFGKYKRRLRRDVADLPSDVELIDQKSNKNKSKGKFQVNPNDEVATLPRLHTNQPNNEVSKCPLEYGVVYTKWGAVSAGSVLAGIAAGSEPQTVNIKELFKFNVTEGNSDNVWGSTIAGNIAEAAFLSKGNGKEIKIGAEGNWNFPKIPHGYYLSEIDNLYYTDAEIRGDLDGLVLGTKMKQYRNSARNMKLSQFLDMYYSERGVFGENLKACRRQELLSEYAPTDQLVKESLAFSLFFFKYVTLQVGLNEQILQSFVKEAVDKYYQYVPTNFRDVSCMTNNVYQVAKTDVLIFLDYEWQYDVMETTLAYLLDSIDINPYNSNYTIVNAKTGQIVLQSTNSISSFYNLFNKTSYETESKGFDFNVSLQKIEEIARAKIDAERLSVEPSSKSLIALFVANNPSVTTSQKEYLITRINEVIRPQLPDLKLLALTGGAKETFQYIVKDFAKDIIQMQSNTNSDNIVNSVTQLVDRIKQVPTRLVSYKCTSKWTEDGVDKSIPQNIEPKGINFYKLSPNYFYAGSNTRIVKIKGQGNTPVAVCHSRDVELPRSGGGLSRNSSRDSAPSETSGVTCKTITTDEYSIELPDPCSGSGLISECAPLYISVEAKAATGGSLETCTDKNCRYTDNIKYTISFENLSCTSSAAILLSNLSLIISMLWFILP